MFQYVTWLTMVVLYMLFAGFRFVNCIKLAKPKITNRRNRKKHETVVLRKRFKSFYISGLFSRYKTWGQALKCYVAWLLNNLFVWCRIEISWETSETLFVKLRTIPKGKNFCSLKCTINPHLLLNYKFN